MKLTQLKPVAFAMLLLGFLTSCANLDSTLFNPDSDLTAYKLNDNDGSLWYWTNPASYEIEDSMIHLLTVESQIPGESTSEEIHAVYLGNLQNIATDTVIVFCHGNTGNLDYYWNRISMLANIRSQHAYGVLAMDYRGFGLSSGTPTEDGMYADVDACLAWLAEQGLTGDRCILYGFSLGTAAELTANPRSLDPAMLILEAPFASADMLGQSSSNLNLSASFYTSYAIDNAEEIKKVEQPFLWMHGMADDYTDFETHGEVVWANYAGSRGMAVRVPDANHSFCPIVLGLDNYLEVLDDFIQGE